MGAGGALPGVSRGLSSQQPTITYWDHSEVMTPRGPCLSRVSQNECKTHTLPVKVTGSHDALNAAQQRLAPHSTCFRPSSLEKDLVFFHCLGEGRAALFCSHIMNHQLALFRQCCTARLIFYQSRRRLQSLTCRHTSGCFCLSSVDYSTGSVIWPAVTHWPYPSRPWGTGRLASFCVAASRPSIPIQPTFPTFPAS